MCEPSCGPQHKSSQAWRAFIAPDFSQKLKPKEGNSDVKADDGTCRFIGSSTCTIFHDGVEEVNRLQAKPHQRGVELDAQD